MMQKYIIRKIVLMVFLMRILHIIQESIKEMMMTAILFMHIIQKELVLALINQVFIGLKIQRFKDILMKLLISIV